MDEWGLTYGATVGYADADDYDDWCSTWVMEQRLLAETALDPESGIAELETRCIETIETLEADRCLDYWGLWD
jgi:hypothetical protein